MNKLFASLLAVVLLAACDAARGPATADEHADAPTEEVETGPNGGRLLRDGDFALELAIFETGVPPEFHAWATAGGTLVEPRDVDLTVELARLGGGRGRKRELGRDIAAPHRADLPFCSAWGKTLAGLIPRRAATKNARLQVEHPTAEWTTGAWIARRAVEEGVGFALVAPCLLLTFLFGPAGYLAFSALRAARTATRRRLTA